MAWVKIDDHFPEHPKVLQVGPLGMAMQIAALCYCNRNLTDGFIPWATANTLLSWEFLGAPEEQGRKRYKIGATCGMVGETVTSEFVINLLLDAGIWEETDGGYIIHDYADYQPTKAEVIAEREQKRLAGKKGGLISSQARAQAKSKQALKQTASTCLSKKQAETQAKSNPVPDPVPVPNTPLTGSIHAHDETEGCLSGNDQCSEEHSATDQHPKRKTETKIKYAEFVSLTNAEYEALVARLGSETRARRAIEILDNYKGAKGTRYKSDYRAILNWVIDRLEEEERKGMQQKPQGPQPPKTDPDFERKKQVMAALCKLQEGREDVG